MWIAIDGMDGSGKNTAANDLKSILEAKGRKVAIFSHPGKECICGRISSKALTKYGKDMKIVSTLFFVGSVVTSLFKMKRSDADDVIFVRYTLSACYLNKGLVRPIYRLITAVLPKPDRLYYKDVVPEDAIARIGDRHDEAEVFENLESLRETREKMYMVMDDWNIIDATLDKAQVKEYLEKCFSDVPDL